MTKAVERSLLEFPQVITVVSKTGRPEIANDPMGVYQTDVIVRLKPPSQWPEAISKIKLIEDMQSALEEKVPGNAFSFTQPIELRVQELVAGVRSDIGLSLYGDDLDTLQIKGDERVQALQRVDGSADVAAQQIAGLSYCRVIIRRDALARYGVHARDVLDAVETIGGKVVGQVFEGQRRFPMQVRLNSEWRTDVEKLAQLKIEDANGRQIPLSQLAVGAKATIREFPKLGTAFLRLREMGLLTGTPITLVRTAPLGDPLEIKIRGYHLTLRKSEADHILVSPAA
jgi:cobalt-zinc-cadmium resistance protein CzcA